MLLLLGHEEAQAACQAIDAVHEDVDLVHAVEVGADDRDERADEGEHREAALPARQRL